MGSMGLSETVRSVDATDWGTPRVAAAKWGPRFYDRGRGNLEEQVGAAENGDWPTPRVSSANGASQAEIAAGDPKHRLETAVAVQEQWPTPTLTGNHNRVGAAETSGDGLATVGRWSTPTTHDAKHATVPPAALNRNSDDLCVQSGASKAAPLNPAWVAILQGFPSDWCDLPPTLKKRKASKTTDGPQTVVKRSTRTNRRVPPPT